MSNSNSTQAKETRLWIAEIIMWALITFVSFVPQLFYILQERGDLSYLIFDRYDKFLTTIFIGIFPYLFSIIFGSLPFELLRNVVRELINSLEKNKSGLKNNANTKIDIKVKDANTQAQTDRNAEIQTETETKDVATQIQIETDVKAEIEAEGTDTQIQTETEAKNDTKEDSETEKETIEIKDLYLELKKEMMLREEDEYYYRSILNEAKGISHKIFSRSGVYLIIGCIVAFSGVVLFYQSFYGQSSLISGENPNIAIAIINFIPRFGTLFFLEFIAFFFFRQHRIMMEEFRYYEKIKRIREDNYTIFKLVEKYKDKDNERLLNAIFEKSSFEKINNKLSKEETTEILETLKLTNSENAVFEKLLDWLQSMKK